ncbi:MAG TPA: LysR family transcriptional regulator [Oxalicibacterium sp.]|uniref:LysR family transcriptional regulator n=1 Tax=Oxalicibacterium sp. TaxID=2766525 RepID=UPI002B96A10E|nr:LysR family transcriptional regulator [Oxalicibacterium sp.]HWU98421.1 LysR family transcriptional regulator [Oxalicibacterium sp.]
MNKIELLRTFVRVAEAGSFTQAAASLGLQKASVSEHVRTLENLVGARLLHRTTRKVQPTHDGIALLERSKDLLSDMDELEGMFRHDGAALEGRLRVDMPTVFARKTVLPHLASFLNKYPHIRIELSSTDRRVDLVREGFDCVVRVGDVNEPSLIARPLGALVMANAASPAYLKIHGVPKKLEDLAQHKLIHYSPILGARPAGFEYVMDGQSCELPMAGNVTVNNADAYEAACLNGLGLVQSPLSGLRAHLVSGALVQLLPDHVPAPMPISLLYAHRRHLSQRVRTFMEWLAALIEQDASAK